MVPKNTKLGLPVVVLPSMVNTMKLIPSKDVPEYGYFNCLSSEDGKVTMGISVVIYGYRVVGYCKGDVGPRVNWCGGDNQLNVERLFSMLKAILEKRDSKDNPFEGLPLVSQIKPFFLDEEFVRTVGAKAGDFTLEKVAPLSEIRERYWKASEKWAA